ncbi:MAG: hypothetical protein EXR48_02655 [Dehalococcoidia bacterium]|nr:hypothetical protein [Dehalococcoidia bacterium]
MPLRFRIYRYMRQSKGSLVRFLLADIAVLVGFGLLVALIDTQIGTPELRKGLVVWYSFLVGFSAVVTLNASIELLGTGYSTYLRSTRRPSGA